MSPVPEPALHELRDFALSLAEISGPLALRYFRHPLTVESKADLSPVTVADRLIEETLRNRIKERYPTHGILGEEYGADALDQEFIWVIDPIDGTKAFVSGNPLFGTLIGLLNEGRPLLGVVDAPFSKERWCGLPGQTQDLAGHTCRTRQTEELSQAILYTTAPEGFSAAGKAIFAEISAAASLTRYGGDCYAYALLAAGHIDAIVEEDLKPYDFLPLIPMIEGAGGCITDWQGQPLTLNADGRVIASANPILHQALVQRCRECP